MAERYDLLTVRESNGKSYFTKLGAMFPNQKGDGFNIVLDGVPASVDGQYRLLAKIPLPKDGQGGNQRQQGGQQSRQSHDDQWGSDSDPAPF